MGGGDGEGRPGPGLTPSNDPADDPGNGLGDFVMSLPGTTFEGVTGGGVAAGGTTVWLSYAELGNNLDGDQQSHCQSPDKALRRGHLAQPAPPERPPRLL